jgi:hypothetical protein
MSTLYKAALAVAAVVSSAYAAPQEQTLALAAASALDRSLADWARSSLLCAAYSGQLDTVPLATPLVELHPNVTGTTQQAVWGLFNKYAIIVIAFCIAFCIVLHCHCIALSIDVLSK